MGVLNVTSDSFSDGGNFVSLKSAVARGLEMVAEGADIVDVGGESSRPGSREVSAAEELERVIPVITALAAQTEAIISVDTVKPEVAEAALSCGASMVNDVSNLRDSDGLAAAAARHDAHLILMHSRGTPRTMTGLTTYTDVVQEVCRELLVSVDKASAAGVAPHRIWIDPGIGFAKTAEQSIEILARLDEIVALGYPVLVGPSRKSFIGEIANADVHHRIGGTAAAVTTAILFGARAVRVHDVAVMRQAVLVARATASARAAGEARCHV
jgi:dihydropteroate synthase